MAEKVTKVEVKSSEAFTIKLLQFHTSVPVYLGYG